eukprot:8375728-Alexandrium_andersonii.AAC.1
MPWNCKGIWRRGLRGVQFDGSLCALVSGASHRVSPAALSHDTRTPGPSYGVGVGVCLFVRDAIGALP